MKGKTKSRISETKHTFIVSDESINSYGFRILTAGINIGAFQKNPIMFYMHERDGGIIGRWDNIRVEDNRLLADAVFNEAIELGQRVKSQVDGGFIRSASIGIENAVQENLNGVETVVKCDLKEISIVDMPSNSNAVKLYRKSGKYVYNLADLEDSDTDDLRGAILNLLGLPDTATDTDILEAVKTLQNSAQNVDNDVDNAIACGYIAAVKRDDFRAMALSNRTAFDSFIELRRNELNKDTCALLDNAVSEGKIIYQDREFYLSIGERLGTATLRQMLNSMRGVVKPTDYLNSTKSHSEWTLNDYRKFDPLALKNDPALYARLVEKEGNAPDNTGTLDYYRRHHPEYLRDNPELYEHLLRKENA